MREVAVGELAATSAAPFVRHAVGPATYDAAWVRGAAVLVHSAHHTVGLGPADDLGPLMAELVARLRPARLSVEEAAYDAVPAAWAYPVRGRWHWMRATEPAPPPTVPLEQVTDAAAIDAVLDVAQPDTFGRPGTPGIEGWLGVRVAGRLVGVGAVRRDPDGSGHLRAVSVLPGETGRGLGLALSAGLTRWAMDRPPHVATLGVYTDNAPALRIYERLGYRVEHTLCSGPLSSPS
ncbi:GNAT family N-acetyltransferase [Nocardioides marmotae]|uniref:GNAT family N-acetyltransferase n=1 Tax=Nocardioides marmotae TaxID=2663857 RepID=UPI0012B58E15|nr:GNAT family N-acetyltransferase [Nocardioides marmotae]MBC9733747.1 GNAT family N-acetyltransferase [Nocardioides marmotae]MTB84850.1 GNAT family N-acetyltransferase [Nocardioides marmotae]